MIAQRQSYVANLAAAQAGLQAGESVDAAMRLAACEPSIRAWEWSYLEFSLDQSVTTFEGDGASKAPPWLYQEMLMKRKRC